MFSSSVEESTKNDEPSHESLEIVKINSKEPLQAVNMQKYEPCSLTVKDDNTGDMEDDTEDDSSSCDPLEIANIVGDTSDQEKRKKCDYGRHRN